jgi:putative toxin-antitoxin system antitoxin component (TIGR02293 family)
LQKEKRGYFSTTESERLFRILKLYHKAVEVFDDNPEYAKKWLKEEAYGLNGAVPLEYARTEIGAKEVGLLLTRIDEGIFA